MRHRKHNHQLGVKSAHRISLIANLSCALIENGRIKTTLAKARALRPAIEKLITLAKKAHLAEDVAQKLHYRRLAIARIRDKKAVKKLFDELVEQFANRNGGYTRIYKLAIPRLGDAADMALIEFVEESSGKKPKKKKASKTKQKVEAPEEKNESQDSQAEKAAETDAQSKASAEEAETAEEADEEKTSDNEEVSEEEDKK